MVSAQPLPNPNPGSSQDIYLPAIGAPVSWERAAPELPDSPGTDTSE